MGRGLHLRQELVQAGHRVHDARVDARLVRLIAGVAVADGVVEVGVHVRLPQVPVVDVRGGQREHVRQHARPVAGEREDRQIGHRAVHRGRRLALGVLAGGRRGRAGAHRRRASWAASSPAALRCRGWTARCCSTRCLSAAPSFFCRLAPSASTASSTLLRTLASFVAWSGIVVVVVAREQPVEDGLGIVVRARSSRSAPCARRWPASPAAPFGVAGVTPTSIDLNGAPARDEAGHDLIDRRGCHGVSVQRRAGRRPGGARRVLVAADDELVREPADHRQIGLQRRQALKLRAEIPVRAGPGLRRLPDARQRAVAEEPQ